MDAIKPRTTTITAKTENAERPAVERRPMEARLRVPAGLIPTALPRAREASKPKAAEPRNLIARLSRFVQDHKKAVGAVMMGASSLPAMTGCATAAFAQTPANTPATPSDPGAVAKFNAYKAQVDALNAKKGTMPYSELAAAREKLYQQYVAGGGKIGLKDDPADPGMNLAREILYGTENEDRSKAADGMSDAYKISLGLDPADPMLKGAALHKAWTDGYIPMAHNSLIENNTLWFYDKLVQARTGVDPETRYVEGKSSIDGGDYFITGSLDEKDAEMSTLVSFSPDGKLHPGVAHDFLKPSATGEATFGTDGKTDETLSVGWWGHCNDVSSAGINFREPKRDVTYDLPAPIVRYDVQTTTYGTLAAESVTKGDKTTDVKLLSGQIVELPNDMITGVQKEEVKQVTFTAEQLKQLAAVLVERGSMYGEDFIGHRFEGYDATITLKNGQTIEGGLQTKIARPDDPDTQWLTATRFEKPIDVNVFDGSQYVTKTFQPGEIASIRYENPRALAPIPFHLAMLEWVGAQEQPGVMNREPGTHVWNYAFDHYDYTATPRANDKNTYDYEMHVYLAANDYPETYHYSITYKDGRPVSGKWADDSTNPSFLWRDKGGASSFDYAPSRGTPVDYKTIQELLNKSYQLEDHP